jgi:hypothetical protein
LLKVRSTLSRRLEGLAESVLQNKPVGPGAEDEFAEAQNLPDPREAEYAITMVSRYEDIESILRTLPPDSLQPFLQQEHGHG